jgi:serine protease Do
MEVGDGYGDVLTNNHVAGDASTIDIQLADGRKIANREVTLVGADPKSDLAVLRIKADRLIAAKWGNSGELERGDWVLAFGSPFGYIGSMTHGIVSAMNRDRVGIIMGGEGYENFIQVDAPINPGNSGGPLVNIHGEVIGINTAIATRGGGFQGIGFAIPSNQAKGVFTALMEHHMVVRGWLGISLQDVGDNPDLAKSFGCQGEHGVIVSAVAPKGPSENKLLPQDIVTAFNGQAVADGQQLRNLVAGIAPGTTANITVFRDGKEQQVQVVVGTQPKDLAAAMEGSTGGGEAEASGENQTLQALGMSLATLDKQTAQKIGIDSGAVITDVKREGLAFNAGLSPGDVITMVFNTPVHSAAEAAQALNAADLKKGVRLYVYTRDQEGHHMYRFVFIKSGDTSPQ